MESLFNHKNLKVFKRFGFKITGESGGNVYGVCPFCDSYSEKKQGSKPSFYIDPESKKWNCKICGLKGGYQKFIKHIYEMAKEQTEDKSILKLSIKKKGIKPKTINKFGLAYFGKIDRYLIPVFGVNKNELLSIRLYNMQDNIIKNIPGYKSLLYNLWSLKDSDLTIYLCEGEWDCMIMDQIIDNLKLDRTIAIAATGATTFKEDWALYFRNKIVHNLYDNDLEKVKNERLVIGAGKQGQKRVFDILKHVTRELKFIHWPVGFESGFDLRDFYLLRKANCEKILKNIIYFLKPEPMPIKAPKGYDKEIPGQEIIKPVEFTGKGLHYSQVYAGYQKWLELDDVECLDVIFGTIIANRFAGDPLWLFLIASSGGTKSELIMSLFDSPLIYPLSSLTPNTLISGSPGTGGGDPSLVPKLNNHVVAMKDATVLFDMSEDSRRIIFSQLRDAYDGTCNKAFGTGIERRYDSQFGFLAGTTPEVERLLEGGSAMGERFISLNIVEDNSYRANKMIMRKAMSNVLQGDKDNMKAELRSIATSVLNFDFGSQPQVRDKYYEQLFCLAQWTSILRGTIPRDKYTRQVTRKPLIEKPTRLVVQFTKLALGITAFRHHSSVSIDEIKMLKRIAGSTIPNHLNKVIHIVCKNGINTRFTEDMISKKLRLPFQAVRKYIEDLFYLGVLERKSVGSISPEYYISKKAKKLIKLGKLYKVKE